MNDEYISRELMLKHLEADKANNAEHCEPVTIQIMERFIRYIREFPAADVQPVKHGRWIEQRHTPTNGYNYNVPYSTYVCSICGLEIHSEEYSKYVRGAYTNCPVCTARMDGADNV